MTPEQSALTEWLEGQVAFVTKCCEQTTIEYAAKDQHILANQLSTRLATLRALVEENERLQRNLDGRDKFIVEQGLWSAFVDQLPPAKRR